MDFLVTGGAGFIGSNIVHRLVAEGATVRVLDILARGQAGRLAALGDAIEYVAGDVSDPAAAAAAARGVRSVLHLAALVSVPGSVREPVRHHAANLTGTLVMLQACCDAGVETFVFSSSCAVYGDAAAGAVDEAAATDPKSPYAVQKLASESYCRVFSELRGLRTFCLRYFNVYGPRQSVDTQYGAVIPNFIQAALSGSAPIVYGDGEQSRDFVYVDDVVDANLRCCRSRMEDAHVVLNIGGGRGTSINALARHVGTASGVTLSPRHVEARLGDVRHSCADASRAAGRLGWQARVPIEEGLARTVAYFRSGRRDG